MDLYISWHTDFDGENPKISVLADDVEGLRRQDQSIEAGNRIWDGWILRAGGQQIDRTGADGRCQVPASELGELDKIRVQFGQTIGNVRVTVGVGTTLSESDRALKEALKVGGDKVSLFTPKGTSLEKAVTASNVGSHAGFMGINRPQGPIHETPSDAIPKPPDEAPPSMAASPLGFDQTTQDAQNAFESHARMTENNKREQQEAEDKQLGSDNLKQEVLKVLKHVKAQAPALQQLSAVEPKLFAAIQGSIRAMLLLAKRVLGTEEVNKSEDLIKKVLDPSAGYQLSHEHVGEGTPEHVTRVSVHSPQGEHVGAATFIHAPEGLKVGTVVVDEDPQRRGLASAMYSHAQTVTGKKVGPSGLQTPEGAALWQGNLKQPQFGKSEDPILKADRYFKQSAFLGKDGTVIPTGGFHDIDQLPVDFVIDQEGFITLDGTFYNRETAQEMSTPLTPDPVQKSEPDLSNIQTEFRGKDGTVIPSQHDPRRPDYDRKHVAKIVEVFGKGRGMNLTPKMVQLSDLAVNSSGNLAVNKSKYNLYRRMLSAGDRLPPIVVEKDGLKYNIVDGSHRVQAILDHNGNKVGVPPKVSATLALVMSPIAKPKAAEPKSSQEKQPSST